jgi:hypothetical protein
MASESSPENVFVFFGKPNSLLEGNFPPNPLIRDLRWKNVTLNTPVGILGGKNQPKYRIWDLRWKVSV